MQQRCNSDATAMQQRHKSGTIAFPQHQAAAQTKEEKEHEKKVQSSQWLADVLG